MFGRKRRRKLPAAPTHSHDMPHVAVYRCGTCPEIIMTGNVPPEGAEVLLSQALLALHEVVEQRKMEME